ncbi:MAG: winged helix-turn-helix domain-containing protein, partial [Nocardioides sp.]
MPDEVHRLSRRDARRIALRAQLLDTPRPTDLFDVVRRLTLLQIDPIKAVAPSADLVLWSRLGASYDPQELSDAVDEQALIELHGLLRPAEDLVLFRAEMAVWPGLGELRDWEEEQLAWLEANNACRLDILDRLRSDGPLLLRELPDTCVVPWKSSGWNDNKNVQRMLIFLVRSGEVAVAGGTGPRRLWDLAERVYLDDPVVPLEEARRKRDELRLRALGLARAR